MQVRPGKVLILGCGTIGQIKAGLWLSLGADVYLYDTSPSQVSKLLTTDKRLQRFGHQQLDNLMIDISTPSDQHASSMSWIYKNIKNPRTILVEKPICTNVDDRAVIKRLLNKHEGVPVFVNESYFWSTALDWTSDQLQMNNEEIISIEINLSKNRLADTRSGRFFDRELESYGIEIPHAIAILQKFGIGIDELSVRTNIMCRGEDDSFNQGVHLILSDTSDRIVKIDSFLGDFMIQADEKIQNSLKRWLLVETDKQNKYHVWFDPVAGEQRFKSIVEINGIETIALDDNHLRRHLEQVQFAKLSTTMKQYLSPANSIAIYDFLERLYASKIEDNVSDKVIQHDWAGERTGVT